MNDRNLDDVLVNLGTTTAPAEAPRLTSSAPLAAVRAAGTRHIYADTADVEEVRKLIATADGAIVCEVDGSTANQPLVSKVIGNYLDSIDIADWARQLKDADASVSRETLVAGLYAALCGRTGGDVVASFAAGRAWGASLQIHMRLAADVESAKRIGRCLRRMVPSGVVKVPFTPQSPQCLLIARDLEREGIPVNFTSTFSARQTVVAALLANVSLTNIFMGRLNQGMKAALLGEHVDLEAQRALNRLRREQGTKTLLIVASVREWQTFVRVAGCDVFTAPCDSIRGLMTQTEIAPEAIRSQLETSYASELGIAADVLAACGPDRIARLYDVEPDLVDFLVELRSSRSFQEMRDGDALHEAFDRAGFGDLFYAPSASEWSEIRRSKLPDFGSELTRRLPLDTLYTLLADADFEKYQEEMDAMLLARLG